MITNKVLHAIAAAAILTAGATAGFGQSSNVLKAEIPFSFKMQSTTLPAGGYEFTNSRTSGQPMFVIRSVETRKSFILMPRGEIDHTLTARDSNARLVFLCDSSSCGLSEIWYPEGSGYLAPRPKLSPAEKERVAVIPLTAVRAD